MLDLCPYSVCSYIYVMDKDLNDHENENIALAELAATGLAELNI